MRVIVEGRPYEVEGTFAEGDERKERGVWFTAKGDDGTSFPGRVLDGQFEYRATGSLHADTKDVERAVKNKLAAGWEDIGTHRVRICPECPAFVAVVAGLAPASVKCSNDHDVAI